MNTGPYSRPFNLQLCDGEGQGGYNGCTMGVMEKGDLWKVLAIFSRLAVSGQNGSTEKNSAKTGAAPAVASALPTSPPPWGVSQQLVDAAG